MVEGEASTVIYEVSRLKLNSGSGASMHILASSIDPAVRTVDEGADDTLPSAEIESIKTETETSWQESTKPFIWLPYVILAVILIGLFGASFARYRHYRRRHERTSPVRVPRLHGFRVSIVAGCRQSKTAECVTSFINEPRYVKSMYPDGDLKQLFGPDGKRRYRRVGGTTLSRTNGKRAHKSSSLDTIEL